MQSLTAGLFAENFFYGYPYDQVVDPLPAEFDYEGAALTNAGTVLCAPGEFTLEYGRDPSLNPDAALPYGGAPDSNDYYLRFPVLSWSGAAGLFLHVVTSDVATLTFDRAWSGYVGDIFSVVVDGVEALTISGSAGYPWVRSSLTLSAGEHDIAFVLSCAPYSAGTVRQGQAQSASVVDLYRFLRITNLSLSNVAETPTAANQRLAMIAEATLSSNPPLLQVTSGPLRIGAQAAFIWPAKLSGALVMSAEATLSAESSFVGKYGQLAAVAETVVTLTGAVENDLLPTPGGFGIDVSAALVTESTLAPDVASYTRPLMYSRVTMAPPVFVAGRPVSPLAVSETEIDYSVEAIALDKINPISPDNVLPVTPTLRWLSLGAHYDPVSDELSTWYDTTGSGTSFTPGAPGVYAPTVDKYAIANRSGVSRVNYPAVHFDATHGDHLLADLPAGSSGISFVVVGTFARYRGALEDSCPILDYASATDVDYSTELSPTRGVFPWAQPDTLPSTLLGLVPANKQEPTVSRLAYAKATGGYLTTDGVVVNDNTPMVLVFSASAAGSFLMATPLITGQTAAAGRMLADLPGAAPDLTETTFALGKARGRPPLNGTFATATMSLLEVSYYARALTRAEATELSDFLVGLYSPLDQSSGPTTTFLGSGNVDTEQCMIYASGPEQPIAMISGSKTTVTDWYLSDPGSLDYVTALTKAGIPLVQLSNRDYTAIITAGENTR